MVGLTLALAIFAADINHNGVVNGGDLSRLLNNWGGAGAGDLNSDGVVDSVDLAGLLSLWNAGWGVHSTGDGEAWFVTPGRVISVGPSPFAGHRRLAFWSEQGAIVAIDMLTP